MQMDLNTCFSELGSKHQRIEIAQVMVSRDLLVQTCLCHSEHRQFQPKSLHSSAVPGQVFAPVYISLFINLNTDVTLWKVNDRHLQAGDYCFYYLQ